MLKRCVWSCVVAVMVVSSSGFAPDIEGFGGSAHANDDDRWQSTKRMRFDVGVGMIPNASTSVSGPSFVLQADRGLWFSRRFGNFLQAFVRGRVTVSVDESSMFQGGIDVSFGLEMFFGNWVSLELFRLGPWLGFGVGRPGTDLLAGIAGGASWAVRPFDDKLMAIRLGMTIIAAGAIAGTSESETDCPMCPGLAATLGFEALF